MRDKKLEEFKRIEDLLYGINYEVWFNLYGPVDSGLGLIEVIRNLISKNSEISGVVSSSPKEAVLEIIEMILYPGDPDSGPLGLESKKAEILELMNRVFLRINIESAEMITKFDFKTGHPAYPVFWDFAYDIHSNGQRWIFIGSSSD